MNDFPADCLSLVADIGGTNTRVALAEGTTILPDTIRKYRNRDYDDLASVLRAFDDEQGGVDCAGACVAVAGPVHDGVAELTNLDWAIDRQTLARATRAEKVAIVNDLQAQGYALGYLDAGVVTQILPGTPGATIGARDAARLVVGIGTGFNAALVLQAGDERLVPPSECGHTSLPVRNGDDLALADFTAAETGFCAVEDILSGRGLERLYRWQAQIGGGGAGCSPSAAAIMRTVGDGSDPVAAAAAQNFTRLLGTVVGDLALIQLPFGGIYLVGGVARSFAPHLRDFGFEQAFCAKGRFGELMADFPVSVVNDDWAALMGCARFLSGLA
jgi:glucokinase